MPACAENVLERAVALVMVEAAESALKIQRLAVGPSHAGQFISRLQVNVARPFDVIAYKKVELPVVVVIDPRATGAPVIGAAAHAGLASHFLEFSSAFIVKKMIAADAGNENIGQAVVVVIADGDTHRIKAYIQPRPCRHVGEMAVAVVVVKRHCRRLHAFWDVPGPIRGIDKEQILVAVAVIIKKRHAAAHGFRQQLLAVSAIDVREVNAAGGRDVSKARLRNLCSRRFRVWRRGGLGGGNGCPGRFGFQRKINADGDTRENNDRQNRPARRAVRLPRLPTHCRWQGWARRGVARGWMTISRCGMIDLSHPPGKRLFRGKPALNRLKTCH